MSAPYKKLLTYKYAYIIFHLNEKFTSRFLGDYKNKRTKEQMDQAARSSKQCLAEGATQGTSLKGYIKMVGITRGSFEELLEDYKDYAIKNNIPIWNWKDERYGRFRRYRHFLKDEPDSPTPPIPPFPENEELVINLMIDVITRECYLVDQQKKSLEEKFIKEGGWTENIFKKKLSERNANLENP